MKNTCLSLLVLLLFTSYSFAGWGKIEQIQVHFEDANPYIAVFFNATEAGDTGGRLLYIHKNNDELRFKMLYSQLLAAIDNSATVGIWPVNSGAEIKVITTTH